MEQSPNATWETRVKIVLKFNFWGTLCRIFYVISSEDNHLVEMVLFKKWHEKRITRLTWITW